MPNIEIHGTGPAQADELRKKMALLLEGAEYRDDIVVSTVDDVVVDIDGKLRPYLRIITEEGQHSEDIVWRLESIKMDMEMLELQKFILGKA